MKTMGIFLVGLADPNGTGLDYDPAVDFESLRQLIAALDARGVRYAIFGAVAMSLHGLVRTTEDLDLFIAPDESNIERLRAALRDVFDDPDIDQITAADLLGEYPSVRYAPRDRSFYLDILTRLGDAFAFDDLDVERVEVGGVTASVVSPRTLFEMKKNTVRARDRADAEMLRREFDLEDE
jgi:hypothetical protein